MPTYEYLCNECEHAFEAVQSFTEAAIEHCPKCDGQVRKVYNNVGVVFKGSGFFNLIHLTLQVQKIILKAILVLNPLNLFSQWLK